MRDNQTDLHVVSFCIHNAQSLNSGEGITNKRVLRLRCRLLEHLKQFPTDPCHKQTRRPVFAEISNTFVKIVVRPGRLFITFETKQGRMVKIEVSQIRCSRNFEVIPITILPTMGDHHLSEVDYQRPCNLVVDRAAIPVESVKSRELGVTQKTNMVQGKIT